MKILRFSFLLAAILSIGYLLFTLLPTSATVGEQTRAEATYAKCQEVEKYYLATVENPLPQISDPNASTSQLIVADGRGFFWNQPNDGIFLPSEEAEAGAAPVFSFAQAGTYLSPQKVSCDLTEGKISIDMTALIRLEGRDEPLITNQVDEMWWSENSETFKGQVVFSTKDEETFLQLDGDFVFRGCNVDGVGCSSIDILLPVALDGAVCADTAASYGLELENPSEIAACTIYTDNLNYFQDDPKEVVVFEQDEEQILGANLQVVNNTWLEVTYQDNSVFEYRGAACYMQYTSDSQQDWENPNFKTQLCSPKEVIQTKESDNLANT